METHTNTLLITVIMGVVFGVYTLILAHKLKIPAIVPLLIGGYLLGPEVLGLIEPDKIKDELGTLISLAVAIILFEGGLSLDPKGYKSEKGVIRKLLSVGVLTTWIGTALLVHFLFKLPWSQSLLAGSMVVVTGPTVIAPLLKRMRLTKKLHHILLYEGVLGDPIGVFLALLCMEWIMATAEEGQGILALYLFLQRFFFGTVFGVLGGLYADFALRKLRIPADLANVFMLGTLLALFGICEWILPETGLLSVTLCGLILGIKQPPYLKKIKLFQVELTDLSIACLFILLAAKLKVSGFLHLGWNGLWLVLGVMFIIRPLGILFSTIGANMPGKEKLMLMWMAPRGIVAASMASLVAVKLEEKKLDGSEFIAAFVFAVIGATVIVQGFSAGLVAKFLGLTRSNPKGWLIIGSHTFGQSIARFLERHSVPVLLLDANTNNVEMARRQGFKAYRADAFDPELLEWESFLEIGNVLALTDNKDINISLCKHWSRLNESVKTYSWANISSDTIDLKGRRTRHVLTDLAKPSKISAQIESGLLQIVPKPQEFLDDQVEILSISGSEVHLNHKSHKQKQPKQERARLVYRKPKEFLTELLSTQHILFLYEIESIRDVFKRLLKLFESENQAFSTNAVLRSFDSEFADKPVTIENGCSLSLVYSDQINEPLIGLARTRMPYRDPDTGKEARIFIFMISPSNDQSKHLKLLASIARFISVEENRKGILEAKGPEEVVSTLRRFDRNS